MKPQDLKKQLITESIIIGASLAVLGGVLFGLSTLGDDVNEKNTQLKAQLNSVTAETNSLTDKYSKVKQNEPLYHEAIEKMRQDELTISREKVRDTFNQFNDKYHLSGLRVVMSGVGESSDAKYKRKSYAMVSSPVVVNFDAISDEDVYHMIEAMQEEFAGAARISKFSIVRNGAVTSGVVDSITQKGVASLVKGEIDFTWYGIKPIEAGDTNAAKPKK